MNAALATREPDTFRWFVLISAALHVGVAAIVTLAPTAPRRPPPAIEVELAPPGGDRSPAGGRDDVGAPPPPAAKPAPPKPAPAPPQPAPAKAAPAPKPAPAAPPAPAPAAKPAAPAAGAAAPAAPAPADAAPAGDALGDIRKLLDARRAAGEGTGSGVGEGFGLPTGVAGRLYFREVEAAIRAAWAVPPGIRRDPVEIEVKIGADGAVLARAMRQSSGESLLDRSAMTAIDQADLPAPPAEFRTPLVLILRLIPPEDAR